MLMSDALTLVDYVSAIIDSDTSIARRFIVEGCIKVDGAVVDDPAFRMPKEQAHRIKINTSDLAKKLLNEMYTEKEPT